jgi:hypothetical protein
VDNFNVEKAKIHIRFAVNTEMKTLTYPQHTLEKAIHAATRAVIRMEIRQADPIEDSMKATLEQANIDALISEAKEHYCEILTEVLGIDNPEPQWKNEWTTFIQMSAKTTTIDGVAYQNLYFPVLQLQLKQWLDQLLESIKKQKSDLKIIERTGASPKEGSRMIAEWLDMQQDFRECVVLCVALRAMNCPNASLWDEAQRIGEFYWQGLMDYEKQNYYK